MHGIAPASIQVLMKAHERFRERAHEINGRESHGAPFFPTIRLAMDLNSFFFALLHPSRRRFYPPGAKESSLFHSSLNFSVAIFFWRTHFPLDKLERRPYR